MENQFVKKLAEFFEKYGSAEVKRLICYFYLGMLRFRDHEELKDTALDMITQVIQEISRIAVKINIEEQADFRCEVYPLLQHTFAFFRISEETGKEIFNYCREQLISNEESLENYLKLKLPAVDYMVDFLKNIPEQLLQASAVMAMVRGNYEERFTLLTQTKFTEAEVCELIKPFYIAKGFRVTENENRYLIFENDNGWLNVVVSVDDDMVQVTVDHMH